MIKIYVKKSKNEYIKSNQIKSKKIKHIMNK